MVSTAGDSRDNKYIYLSKISIVILLIARCYTILYKVLLDNRY